MSEKILKFVELVSKNELFYPIDIKISFKYSRIQLSQYVSKDDLESSIQITKTFDEIEIIDLEDIKKLVSRFY